MKVNKIDDRFSIATALTLYIKVPLFVCLFVILTLQHFFRSFCFLFLLTKQFQPNVSTTATGKT